MVVAVGKDRVMEGVIWGNIHMAFISKDMIIVLPVQEIETECCRDILQRCLQVLEDKGVRF